MNLGSLLRHGGERSGEEVDLQRCSGAYCRVPMRMESEDLGYKANDLKGRCECTRNQRGLSSCIIYM